jgi:hypothetical protein
MLTVTAFEGKHIRERYESKERMYNARAMNDGMRGSSTLKAEDGRATKRNQRCQK